MRTIDVYETYIKVGNYREAGIKFWEYGMLEEAKKQFVLSKDQMLVELIDTISKNNKNTLSVDIVNYFLDVKTNSVATNFILETLNKDVLNIKNGLNQTKQNFKKGRK